MLEERRKKWQKALKLWYEGKITDKELKRFSYELFDEKIEEIVLEKIKQIIKDPEERRICVSFGKLESNLNPFAVGDLDIIQDMELPRKERGSWGVFQIYQPIHKSWVNFDRIKRPDIGYQILIWQRMWNDLKKRYKTLQERVMRYNGSGPQTIIYWSKWKEIYDKQGYIQ